MENKVNFNINEGTNFLANETSVTFNPLQFVLDFKTVTPRIDIRSKDSQLINIQHNVVIMLPYQAKEFLELLTKAVSAFEKKVSKIDKPNMIKELEKKSKKDDFDYKKISYFG